METHVVVKQFDGSPGVHYVTGQRVDASDWRNTSALVRMRYLRALLATEAAPSLRPVQDKSRKG